MSASLTFRQERFALEYLKDQNASAAAARAGYQAKNMAAQGHELLNNPAIRDRIRMEMDAMLAEIRCSAFALMKQRMKAAFFDAGKLFKGGWEVRSPEELDGETRSAVEVSTVTRKSGPVVRMKQPDRDRALRALEKVHERLEKLGEAHYAALAKAGKLPTLQEIEAMDAGEAPAQPAAPAENAERCRVLSGSTFHPADLGSPGPVPGLSERGTRPSTGSGRTVEGCEIPEKCRVLSGSAGGLNTPASRIPVKTQVLSGSAFSPAFPSSPDCSPGLGGRPARPSTGSGRTAGGCEIPEKPRVLSGSLPRLSPLAAAIRGMAGAVPA